MFQWLVEVSTARLAPQTCMLEDAHARHWSCNATVNPLMHSVPCSNRLMMFTCEEPDFVTFLRLLLIESSLDRDDSRILYILSGSEIAGSRLYGDY